MKKFLRFMSVVAMSMVGVAGMAQEEVVFEETFSNCEGTGGNDDAWSGSIAAGTFVSKTDGDNKCSADNEGWTLTKGAVADGCIKLGTSSVAGKAYTPALSKLTTADATLTFRAGAWLNDKRVLTITVDGNGSVEPESVELASGSFNSFKIKISGGDKDTKIGFEAADAAKSRFFLDDVKIVAGWVTEETVGVPVITPAELVFDGKTSVSIVAEEGATVYYTTNGDEPTTSSNVYSAAFDVDNTCAIKAIAVKGDVVSNVSSVSVTKITVMSVADVMEWAASKDYTKNTETLNYVRVNFNNAKVIRVDGNNYYVQEGKAAALLNGYYFTTNGKNVEEADAVKIDIKEGDLLSGEYKCYLKAYFGVPQISSTQKDGFASDPTVLTVTKNSDAAVAVEASVAELKERKYICNLVTVSGVKLKYTEVATNKSFFYVIKGTDKVEVETYEEGVLDPSADYSEHTYTIKAIVTGLYDGQDKLHVVSAVVDGDISVKAPEFAGDVNAYFVVGQIVKFTVAEGTEAYYTTDGTTPTKESAKYADGVAVTAETQVIKIIAYNNAGDESDVTSVSVNIVTKEYTISEFKAVDAETVGILKLDGAVVTYINTNAAGVYVTDGTSNILLYGVSELAGAVSVGTKLTGSAVFQFAPYNGTNELKPVSGTDQSNFMKGRGAASPKSITLAEAMTNEYTEALVTLQGYIKLSSSKYYLVENLSDKATSGIQLYDSFKLADYKVAESAEGAEMATVTGIMCKYQKSGTTSVTWEILPTVVPVVPTVEASAVVAPVVESVDAPAYDLTGRRVSENYKGVIIRNGKKYIKK